MSQGCRPSLWQSHQADRAELRDIESHAEHRPACSDEHERESAHLRSDRCCKSAHPPAIPPFMSTEKFIAGFCSPIDLWT